MSGNAADKRCTGGISAGGRNKHHKGDDQHLGEIRQAAFACVMLQIGVGHKTDDGVKAEIRPHRIDSVGIKKQKILQSQYEIAQKHHHAVCGQQCGGILFPVHLLIGMNTAQPINRSVYPVKNHIGGCVLVCHNAVEISADRNQHPQCITGNVNIKLAESVLH